MTAKPASPALRMAIDYGPLIVFIAITFFAPSALAMRLVGSMTTFLPAMDRVAAILISKVIVATAAFMLATLATLIYSYVKLGHISPMQWITGCLVMVFGGLTIAFHDQRFLQMKPTFVYGLFAGLLIFGLATRRPLLQQLLGTAYPGLNTEGWNKLTRNWAIFFVLMALLNEGVWRTASVYLSPEDALKTWALFKFPGCLIITALFAIANIPMLMRYGLKLNENEAISELPPE